LKTDLHLKRPKHQKSSVLSGYTGKEVELVLFCASDWQLCPCEPDLLIRQQSVTRFIVALCCSVCCRQ